eukprot:CAMPEP_0167784174 /NCGR_PEP_ID=MMETSP0111_2-20121227/7488_1 /TAXON_ID=91324 /ORGANISM="Lotharella globosa, Strain CCCM811" /LENGTH=1561 /DNA_ID=CAMNT_0007675211 /DNA_START=235 /DNA_END=4920 /DNA_ORIENTATION=+
MSVTIHQFTYYTRGGDSFPLGFMDTHDILMVKEVEKNDRRFDLIANGQVLKLMAPDASEAEVWIKTIKAIKDAVKYSKHAIQKLGATVNRRKVATPKWKKGFWQKEVKTEWEIDDLELSGRLSNKLSKIEGAAGSLFQYASEKKLWRLMKKLLVKYDDDIKLIKLIVRVLLNEEKPQQRPPSSLEGDEKSGHGSRRPSQRDSKLPSRDSMGATTVTNYEVNHFFGSRARSNSAHRRSNTGVKWKSELAKTTTAAINRTLARSNSSLLILDPPEADGKTSAPKLTPSKPKRNLWFYMDRKVPAQPLMKTLDECLKDNEQFDLFKTYLKTIYQDQNFIFLRDSANFKQGLNIEGKTLEGEDLSAEGWRIFDKFIKHEADCTVDPTEKERRKIRQILTSEDPRLAFEPVMVRVHDMIEEQFREYCESDFYLKISASSGPVDEHVLSQMVESGEVSGSTLVWKDGAIASLWKKAETIDIFKEALFEKKNKGELSPDEVGHLFRWITQSGGGVLSLLDQGINSTITMIRSLSYRALLLTLRAQMGYDDTSEPHAIGKAFCEFVKQSRACRKEPIPINQVMEDHHTLIAIMFNPCNKFDCDFDGSSSLKPGRYIYNATLWPAIFENLYGSNIYPRIKSLQDTYYKIISQKSSALALISVPSWQASFLPLAFDVPHRHQSASVGKMRTFIIAIIVQLLWTCVEHKQFEDFATEVRLTIGMTLSVCGDQSGSLVSEVLSATASRFHTDITKWIKLEEHDQMNRYKCLLHLIRLLISMGLSISGRRFGITDSLRTHKVLHKEYHEKKHVIKSESKRGSAEGTSTTAGALLNPSDEGSFSKRTSVEEDNPRIKRENSGTAIGRTGSHAEDHRRSKTVATPHSLTEEGRKNVICNDQDLLYMMKVYNHSQEHQMRTKSSSAHMDNMTGSHGQTVYSSPYLDPGSDDEEEDDGGSLRLENKRFVLSAHDIIKAYNKRLNELKTSIEKFGDSDHICADSRYKTHVQLQAYNTTWHLSLKGYIDALSKIQMLLLQLKAQDDQLAQREDANEKIQIGHSCRRARDNVIAQLSFVNDTVGFLDLMDKKLWKLLNMKQVRDLVHHFVETADPIRRRKVFHGWEKEKKKNQAKQTKELEKRLREEEERRKRTYTMLLIGPGQSGKSTVFKQLTILHGRGFSEGKRRHFRKLIYANIVGAIKNLMYHARKAYKREDESLPNFNVDQLGAMHEILEFCMSNEKKKKEEDKVMSYIRSLNELNGLTERYRSYLLEAATDEDKLKLALQTKKEIKTMNQKCAKFREKEVPGLVDEFFKSFGVMEKTDEAAKVIAEATFPNVDMNKQLREAIRTVWKDRAIRNIFHRRQRFKTNQLDDSSVYMLQHLDRILDDKEEYVPTLKDIVHCRKRTIGIVEGEFKIKDQIFKIVDVAGQRGSRSRWIPLFTTANACLFVCSLAGYNRYLLEENDKLRIYEGLELFDDIVNQPALRKVPIILFLNKVDLFEKEIKTTSLQHAFPQYSGAPDSLEESIAFLRHRFQKTVRDPNRQVFIHTTCATDTEQVEKILDSVTKIVVQKQLAAANLI